MFSKPNHQKACFESSFIPAFLKSLYMQKEMIILTHYSAHALLFPQENVHVRVAAVKLEWTQMEMCS